MFHTPVLIAPSASTSFDTLALGPLRLGVFDTSALGSLASACFDTLAVGSLRLRVVRDVGVGHPSPPHVLTRWLWGPSTFALFEMLALGPRRLRVFRHVGWGSLRLRVVRDVGVGPPSPLCLSTHWCWGPVASVSFDTLAFRPLRLCVFRHIGVGFPRLSIVRRVGVGPCPPPCLSTRWHCVPSPPRRWRWVPSTSVSFDMLALGPSASAPLFGSQWACCTILKLVSPSKVCYAGIGLATLLCGPHSHCGGGFGGFANGRGLICRGCVEGGRGVLAGHSWLWKDKNNQPWWS